MSKTYTEKVVKAQSLAEGLKRNFDKVKGLGITNEQISMLIKVSEETSVMSDELDGLRETVKQKATSANAKLTELTDILRSLKQIVKTNFEQTVWHDFGIEDKR